LLPTLPVELGAVATLDPWTSMSLSEEEWWPPRLWWPRECAAWWLDGGGAAVEIPEMAMQAVLQP
jgi:hypothetical protein